MALLKFAFDDCYYSHIEHEICFYRDGNEWWTIGAGTQNEIE